MDMLIGIGARGGAYSKGGVIRRWALNRIITARHP